MICTCSIITERYLKVYMCECVCPFVFVCVRLIVPVFQRLRFSQDMELLEPKQVESPKTGMADPAVCV